MATTYKYYPPIKFELGMVVRLKSGGYKMVVEGINDVAEELFCVWHTQAGQFATAHVQMCSVIEAVE